MISILMPVKNAANFLVETLESILNQSFTDWELIAVNDGSTDGSGKILESFSLKDKRIKPLNNDGAGIIDALKLAYLNAKGTYISRMDADDLMLPDKLQSMHAKLLEHPSSIITTYVEYFSESGIGDGYKKYENWLNSLIDNQNHYAHIYQECVLPSPNWLMEKETLDAIGGFASLSYPEDYDLCFKAYQKEIPIVGIPEVLHKWRDYPERTSRNDPNYADNRFLSLKVQYFLEIDLKTNDDLYLLGAGKKGKSIAKLLVDAGIAFTWLTNNLNKVGHEIHGVVLENENDFPNMGQLIVAIASPNEQEELRRKLANASKIEAFWFC